MLLLPICQGHVRQNVHQAHFVQQSNTGEVVEKRAHPDPEAVLALPGCRTTTAPNIRHLLLDLGDGHKAIPRRLSAALL